MVHGRAMKVTLRALTILAVGLFAECAKERALAPGGHISYRLYVATWADDARIHIFDTSSDSLIDSTDAVFSNTIVSASSDGKYFFRFNYPSCAEVWDAETITKLRDVPGCGQPVSVRGGKMLLGMGIRAIDYISLPEFAIMGHDTMPLPPNSIAAYPQILDSRREAVFFKLYFGGGSIDSVDIAAWDYRHRQVYGYWNLYDALHANTRVVYSFSLSPVSDDLFMIVSPLPGPRLVCLDLATNTPRWIQGIPSPLALVQVSPDGREVWRAHRGEPSDVPAIYVHDPGTGSIVDSVSLRGLIGSAKHFLSIQDLVFTPDGEKVYASAGSLANPTYSGPVYVIDVKNRTVIGTLLDDGGHYPYFMDVGLSP